MLNVIARGRGRSKSPKKARQGQNKVSCAGIHGGTGNPVSQMLSEGRTIAGKARKAL